MNLSAATSTGLFMCFATGFVTALTGARVDSALKIDKKCELRVEQNRRLLAVRAC